MINDKEELVAMPTDEPKTAKGNLLILVGLIRGIVEHLHSEADKIKELEAIQGDLRLLTLRNVDVFLFEGGAACVLRDMRGVDILPVSRSLAVGIADLSGERYFYHTCSFRVNVSEALIAEDIRIARQIVNNHQECAGAFFIDGRLSSINDRSVSDLDA